MTMVSNAVGQARYRERQKQRGRCVTCNSVLADSRTRCDSCFEKMQDDRRKRSREFRNSGRCQHCGKEAVAGVNCLEHWFQHAAYMALGISTNEARDAVMRQWDLQGGVCALTGVPLIPGGNASLDHRLPKSRGGANSADNLQWVTKTVNYAKRNLTDAEFVELARAVVARADAAAETTNVVALRARKVGG